MDLREKIGQMFMIGFDGVIITDDMNMLTIAVNFSVEEVMVKATTQSRGY